MLFRIAVSTVFVIGAALPGWGHCGCDLDPGFVPGAKAYQDAMTRGGHPWQPQPDQAAVMIVGAHPDDEGLFLGGVIPYYTQVRNLPVVLVDLVSSRPNNPVEQATREQELRNAAWVYGMRNEPIFARFRDHSDLPGGTGSLANTWNAWDGDITNGVADLNGNGVPDGREAAALYLAEQIRRYQPSVLVAHDQRGEYGHGAHQAASIVFQDAYTLAADASLDIAGLDPWQADKLYIHMFQDYRDPGVPVLNHFYHDFSIAYPEMGGLSAAQVTDLGVLEHASEGGQNLLNAFAGNRFIEQWALRFSEVGGDTTGPMMIDGSFYAQMATGDFFENIDLSRFAALLADSNGDGVVGIADLDLLLANWGEHVPIGSVAAGDADGDGVIGQGDLDLLIAGWGQGTFPGGLVPEPGTFVLLAMGVLTLPSRGSHVRRGLRASSTRRAPLGRGARFFDQHATTTTSWVPNPLQTS